LLATGIIGRGGVHPVNMAGGKDDSIELGCLASFAGVEPQADHEIGMVILFGY
jgi:hypothetical protein